ncbi:MAG: hypothetical protein KGM42_15725 [Hyphomicrobiales bacterium]|nr:hypothetical protein [Hyphomicrobiales bacterium]
MVYAGDGWHLVLAAMDRTNVSVGQFVLAGEPVGVMGWAGGHRSAVAISASR